MISGVEGCGHDVFFFSDDAIGAANDADEPFQPGGAWI